MIEKSDSKWISLAAASILGQAPRKPPLTLLSPKIPQFSDGMHTRQTKKQL
ncbi:MAG: hypothetical protein V3V31_08275 [Methylococcales bacterium]